MIITIDGPTASGKSSTARALADILHLYYLNSGALYRALAYLLLHQAHYRLEDLTQPHQHDIEKYLDPAHFVYQYTPKQHEKIIFDATEITPFLKGAPLIDQAASLISTNPHVRKCITTFSRAVALHHPLVTDGRDMGSCVFPQASYKFFLTASLEVRAQRWQHDMHQRGMVLSLAQAEEQLIIRDKRDLERTIAPLIVPQNAIMIDNSFLSSHETIDTILQRIPTRR